MLGEDITKKDEVIISGDANAQIGKEPCLREIIGNRKGTKHKEINGNGRRILMLLPANMAVALNLTIPSKKLKLKTKSTTS